MMEPCFGWLITSIGMNCVQNGSTFRSASIDWYCSRTWHGGGEERVVDA